MIAFWRTFRAAHFGNSASLKISYLLVVNNALLVKTPITIFCSNKCIGCSCFSVIQMPWCLWAVGIKSAADTISTSNICALALWWRHNERDCVSNHQPRDGLRNRLFRHIWKETSKLRVTGLCAGNSPVTGEFRAQMASNAWKCFHLMTSSWRILPSSGHHWNNLRNLPTARPKLTGCGQLTPNGDIDLACIDSDVALLPDGTRPLPKPMLTPRVWNSVEFTRE